MGPGPSPSPSPTPNAARTLTSHSLGAMASSAAAVSIAVTRAALGCGARTRREVARDENATLPTSSSPSMVVGLAVQCLAGCLLAGCTAVRAGEAARCVVPFLRREKASGHPGARIKKVNELLIPYAHAYW